MSNYKNITVKVILIVMISKDDIKKLANLSRIEVAETELASVAKEIDDILGYVGEIQKVVAKSENVIAKPTLRNIFREDEVFSENFQKELIESAPENEESYVKVKKIL